MTWSHSGIRLACSRVPLDGDQRKEEGEIVSLSPFSFSLSPTTGILEQAKILLGETHAKRFEPNSGIEQKRKWILET